MKISVEKIFFDLFVRYPELEAVREDVASAFCCLRDTYENGGKLLVCGNGGSAADSAHIVGELMKGFKLPRKLSENEKAEFERVGAVHIPDGLQGALPAISLVGEAALMTAFLNDCSPDLVFAQQVYGLLNKGDTLLCLSTSGNSLNVVNAAYTAAARGGKVISIVGESWGKLSRISDVTVKLPSKETYIIQEYTLPVYHCLCAMLEEEFFG